MLSRSVILVAEDAGVIGFAIADELEEAGFQVAGPFATCTGAMAWLNGLTPQCAVLDVQLRDGPCIELAAELQRRGIPIIVHSGLEKDGAQHPAFAGATWVPKPSPSRAIPAAVTEAIQR